MIDIFLHMIVLIAFGRENLTTVFHPAFDCFDFRLAPGAPASRFRPFRSRSPPARLPVAFTVCISILWILVELLDIFLHMIGLIALRRKTLPSFFPCVRLFRLSVGVRRFCLRVWPCCGAGCSPARPPLAFTVCISILWI